MRRPEQHRAWTSAALDACEHVGRVDAAHVVQAVADEALPASGAAADVGVQHRVALGSQQRGALCLVALITGVTLTERSKVRMDEI